MIFVIGSLIREVSVRKKEPLRELELFRDVSREVAGEPEAPGGHVRAPEGQNAPEQAPLPQESPLREDFPAPSGQNPTDIAPKASASTIRASAWESERRDPVATMERSSPADWFSQVIAGGNYRSMPADVLQRLVKLRVDVSHNATALEVLLGQLVAKAMNGEKWALEKVYDELQHQGAQTLNVNTTVSHEPSQALQEVLQRAGLNSIDVSPDKTH